MRRPCGSASSFLTICALRSGTCSGVSASVSAPATFIRPPKIWSALFDHSPAPPWLAAAGAERVEVILPGVAEKRRRLPGRDRGDGERERDERPGRPFGRKGDRARQGPSPSVGPDAGERVTEARRELRLDPLDRDDERR